MLKKQSFTILITWILVITFLSLIDLSSIDIEIKTKYWIKFDKIVHFVFYFTLTFLLFNSFTVKKIKINAQLISVIIAVIYGIIIEILQDIVPTKRSFDYFDIVANTLGSLTMLIVLNYFKKK